MITNWKELALKVGSLRNDGSGSGGDSYDQAAFIRNYLQARIERGI